jgi:hypothetical protein
MKKSFNTSFNIGEEVYLRTEPDTKRIVSGYLIRSRSVTIGLVKGDEESWHQEIELIRPIRIKVKGFGKG